MNRDYKTFFAICKAIGRDKEDVILEFTNGESSSLKSLDEGEYKELMIQLRRLQPTTKATWKPPSGDAQRKKMIGLARDMHWGKTIDEIIGKLNDWCLKQKFKKKLNDLSEYELGILLTIFQNKIYTGYLKSIKS